MQTGKETIKNAIEFKTPDRLPIIWNRDGSGDVVGIPWNQIGTGDNRQRNTFDEWGCGWQRTEVPNMGQITYHPLEKWENYESYKFPNPDSFEFYDGVKERAESCDCEKYVMTNIFLLLFDRLNGLRGYENLLADLYLEREKVEELADRVVEFDLRVIENMNKICCGKIDGFKFSDDWGNEISLMINPKLWNDFFKPRYKKIFDKCHEYGWHVWMHSCGRVNEIISPLIEIGCNVLNLQQPLTLGIEEIGKLHAGKVCFETTCDIQHTLPSKKPEEIEKEARTLIECWGTDEGGLIFGSYGDTAAIGASDENIEAMLEAFHKHDRWKRMKFAK